MRNAINLKSTKGRKALSEVVYSFVRRNSFRDIHVTWSSNGSGIYGVTLEVFPTSSEVIPVDTSYFTVRSADHDLKVFFGTLAIARQENKGPWTSLTLLEVLGLCAREGRTSHLRLAEQLKLDLETYPGIDSPVLVSIGLTGGEIPKWVAVPWSFRSHTDLDPALSDVLDKHVKMRASLKRMWHRLVRTS